MGDLPENLKVATAGLLEGVSRIEVASRAEKLSALYRSGRVSAAAIGSRLEAIAYVVSRMPATFAAIAAAIREVRLAAPSFAPSSLVDVGAGPGTASWAAVEAWPAIGRVAMIDASPHFLDLAGELASASILPALAEAARIRADATREARLPASADLVVAAYTLAELRPSSIDRLLATLWEAALGVLVLVEPGTPAGVGRIPAPQSP